MLYHYFRILNSNFIQFNRFQSWKKSQTECIVYLAGNWKAFQRKSWCNSLGYHRHAQSQGDACQQIFTVLANCCFCLPWTCGLQGNLLKFFVTKGYFGFLCNITVSSNCLWFSVQVKIFQKIFACIIHLSTSKNLPTCDGQITCIFMTHSLLLTLRLQQVWWENTISKFIY